LAAGQVSGAAGQARQLGADPLCVLEEVGLLRVTGGALVVEAFPPGVQVVGELLSSGQCRGEGGSIDDRVELGDPHRGVETVPALPAGPSLGTGAGDRPLQLSDPVAAGPGTGLDEVLPGPAEGCLPLRELRDPAGQRIAL